jgi:hypothetical protein
LLSDDADGPAMLVTILDVRSKGMVIGRLLFIMFFLVDVEFEVFE